MRKVIFVLTSILSVVLLVRILRIIVKDYHQLTEYGFGYLVGLSIIFIILAAASYFLGRKLIK